MDIIDQEFQEQLPEFNLFRPIALLLEWPLILVSMVGILIGSEEVKTVAILTLCAIYLGLSWYIFKAEKFKAVDVIVSIICGLGIAVILVGLLFELQNWPYKEEMVICGLLTLYICLPLSLLLAVIRTATTSNQTYELRNSWKLFSRLMVLLLMHYALGVGGLLMDLVNK